MRIGALDLGSNSFHLLVAEVRPDGTFTTITTERDMLRLGDEVSSTGRISPASIERVVASVRRLRALAEASGATEIIAKATSAVRTAENGSEVVDRIEAGAGVEVDVISGLDEARLIFAAVRASVTIADPPALCLDLGGGSLEITVGDAGGVRYATSEPLGVGRLTARFVHSDPIAKRERRELEDHVRSVLEPQCEPIAALAPRCCIVSSGTLSDLATAAHVLAGGSEPDHRNQLTVERDAVLDLHSRLLRADARERRRFGGIDERRIDLVVAGSVVLTCAMELFGAEAVTVSAWALREGIVLDAVGHHDPTEYSDDPRALRRAAVRALAQRCGSDDAHTEQVTRLALSLFDQTEPLHHLGHADREILEYATLLHDIGQHVSPKGHHRHAAYLVQNAQLRGFSPEEVAMLAAVVRHHRRGEPKDTEPFLAAVPGPRRSHVRKLAAILRVADGLDRGRTGVVSDVKVRLGEDLVLLRVSAAGDPELSLWGVRRRRELFEKIFGRDLEVTATRT